MPVERFIFAGMIDTMTIRPMGDHLYLVPLPVPVDGFEGFITAWVYTGGPVVLVDVGPSVSAPHLLTALADIGVHHLDLILLTHVHIDHAGGIGEIARAFPDTPVVCHPKAVEHLIDPGRLWDGSVRTLGDVAHKYGPIAPVAAAQVLAVDHLASKAVIAVPTPGHAVHHYSYMIKDLLFAGEAGGVCVCLEDGEYYMRPATPPRFIMEIYLDSIDRLLTYHPQSICYGHIGRQTGATRMLAVHRDQLLRWQRMVQPWVARDPAGSEEMYAACLADLLAKDPLLAGMGLLPSAAQARERFFLRNSVRGYWGYLQRSAQASQIPT